jgi:hypothetical protein
VEDEMLTEITVEKNPGELPIVKRYGVTVPVAAAYSGLSRSRIYELLTAGELDGKIIKGRRIVVVQSLLRMCGAAPSAARSEEANSDSA